MVAALPLPGRALCKKLKARSGGFTLPFLGITYAPQESRNFQRPEFYGAAAVRRPYLLAERTEFLAAFSTNTLGSQQPQPRSGNNPDVLHRTFIIIIFTFTGFFGAALFSVRAPLENLPEANRLKR